MKPLNISQFYDWLKPLAKKDFAEFDLHAVFEDQHSVLFQKQELKNYSSAFSCHINLRVLKGGRMGVSWAKKLSQDSLKTAYQQAIQALDFSDKKEEGALAEGENYKDFSGFYDSNLKEMALKTKIQKTKEMNSACLKAKVQAIYSQVKDTSSYRFFVNSKGEHSFYQKSDVLASCYSLGAKGESRSNGFSTAYAKSYNNIDFKHIGCLSANRALKKLNSVIPQTKKYPVIFKSGQVLGELLPLLVQFMSAKKLYEGLSIFKQALEKKLFSKHFNLIEDPKAVGGLGSRPFDGEGFSTEKTTLVEKGVLKNYLSSSFYAKILKIPHTKKACWINDKLDVSHSNLVMQPGESLFEDLLKEFPQVIVIDYLKGFAGFNHVSGDFSIESEGFLWEGGESRPLSQFTVSGNIKNLFLNILKIAQESEIYKGQVKASSVLVPELMISGQ